MNSIDNILSQMVNRQNNQPLDDFEGYSPFEMYNLLYDPFGPYSPMVLKRLPDAEYDQIHLFANFKYLVHRIAEAGEIKLTSAGYLPPALCKDIYLQGNIKDYFIETGYTKSYREVDTEILHLTHVLTEITAVVKKRNQRLSMTAKGLKIYQDPVLLFEHFFKTYVLKYNWAYQDRYENMEIGKTGFAYSLFLLCKYGETVQHPGFYANLYFKALPVLAVHDKSVYTNNSVNAYEIRTIVRFMSYFNFCSTNDKFYININEVQKTPLFDKLFQFHPHIDYSEKAMA